MFGLGFECKDAARVQSLVKQASKPLAGSVGGGVRIVVGDAELFLGLNGQVLVLCVLLQSRVAFTCRGEGFWISGSRELGLGFRV